MSSCPGLTLVAVEAAGRQADGLSEVDDGLLHPAHVAQSSSLQQQGLDTVAVQLDSFGSQV